MCRRCITAVYVGCVTESLAHQFGFFVFRAHEAQTWISAGTHQMPSRRSGLAATTELGQFFGSTASGLSAGTAGSSSSHQPQPVVTHDVPIGPRDALLRSWFSFHDAVCHNTASFTSGGCLPRLQSEVKVRWVPLGPKEEHIKLGFHWSDALQLAVRKATTSITRGIAVGPRIGLEGRVLVGVSRMWTPWRQTAGRLRLILLHARN